MAGKRGLPRGRAPGFMCNAAAEFHGPARSVKPSKVSCGHGPMWTVAADREIWAVLRNPIVEGKGLNHTYW